jgi:transaldolase
MVGRTDDWVKVSAERAGISIDPAIMDWAGIAAFKNAYKIFQERGYRTRLLAAAFRNHMHWSELLGGDTVISPPYAWQVSINSSEIVPDLNSINNPIEDRILQPLLSKSAEFRKAYEPDGLQISDFSNYGATARTLRGFLQATNDLESFVRDVLIPDPDK